MVVCFFLILFLISSYIDLPTNQKKEAIIIDAAISIFSLKRQTSCQNLKDYYANACGISIRQNKRYKLKALYSVCTLN